MESVSEFPPGAVVGKDSIRINDIQFKINYSADMLTMESAAESFVLPKTFEMVSYYYRLGQTASIKNIVDLGIFKGGSAALFHLLYRPEKLVALDISDKREQALDGYIEKHFARDTLRPFYGYDQGNGPRLQELIRTEFGAVPLDLVVDDASHAYSLTRASFNTLFPYLRPGGTYVIEDWGWAHWDGWAHMPSDYQQSGGLFPGQPAMTNLIFELIMAAATSPGVIARVSVTFNMAVIEKGPDTVDPLTFDVGAYHVARGHQWQPIL
ncbi:MAG TPA: class I SAM-dependent methyltransferase [Terriglobia bacterium]|jgi:SAM-dependent methyltransferase